MKAQRKRLSVRGNTQTKTSSCRKLPRVIALCPGLPEQTQQLAPLCGTRDIVSPPKKLSGNKLIGYARQNCVYNEGVIFFFSFLNEKLNTIMTVRQQRRHGPSCPFLPLSVCLSVCLSVSLSLSLSLSLRVRAHTGPGKKM